MPTRRVLVIERSPTVALMICGLLRRWGMTPVQPATPEDTGGPYDLVIAPPINGGRDAAWGTMPWLALLPAGALAPDAAAGAAVKPIRPEDLRQEVLRCLGRPAPAPDGIDLAAIAELWGGFDNPTFRAIAEAFLGEMDERLAAIAAALTANDRKQLQREAHSVRGASANVGATAVAAAAGVMEKAAPAADAERLANLATALSSCAARDLTALRRLIASSD